MYKILLPKGSLSSKEDVIDFLEHMKFMEENYQIGITKVSGYLKVEFLMKCYFLQFVGANILRGCKFYSTFELQSLYLEHSS